jgi:hypothetical protein
MTRKTWKQALEESIKHHRDNLKVLETWKADDFRAVVPNFLFFENKETDEFVYFDGCHCSLCIRKGAEDCCRHCPLAKFQGTGCDGNTVWRKFSIAMTLLQAIAAEKGMIKALVASRRFV